MTTDRVVHKLDFRGKALLSLTCVAFGLCLVLLGSICSNQARAQAAAVATAHDLTGTWQGTLQAGRELRTVLKVSKAASGWTAEMYSLDQGARPIPVTAITLQGSDVKYSIEMIDGTYEGKLSGDGNSIAGTWTQGSKPLPLNFTRATPATAWTIPTPPPVVPPMAADASPGFEVATIKPSKPGTPGKGFGFRGRQFTTMNTNVNDLIAIAYGLHAKQIVDAPAWFGTDLYDVAGVPDVAGRPNQKQMGIMLQKLLADRFKLKFHKEKRVLSVYTITVARGGPKMKKSSTGPNDPEGFLFRGLGDLIVRNLTMAGFATWMQAAVMDRPVVDQTGLTDRYDFLLKWTPDESQFAQFRGTGVKFPTASTDPNAPPGLYTAIQEQLGLKLEATKVPDEVIVIDHAEKPSQN